MDKFEDLEYQEEKLYKNIKSFPTQDSEEIIEAYNFAKDQHQGQERIEGIPYIIHLLRVANLLIEKINIDDPNIIRAGMLHDVIEDTEVELDEIENIFGKQTARLVKNLTRIKKPDETLENRYKRKYKKFEETINKDYPTRAIKTCDILDNMMSWKYIPEDHPYRNKFPRWFKETKTINIPLAKTVDKKIAKQMEDIVSELE